jgi:hypothetical protein
MMDWMVAAIISLIVGVVLLAIEYRTGWFADRITKTLGKGIDLTGNWATTIYQVRLGLGRIYAVSPEEITVDKWEPKFFGLRVRLQVMIPSPVISERYGTGSRLYECLIVWADRAGRILNAKQVGPDFHDLPSR